MRLVRQRLLKLMQSIPERHRNLQGRDPDSKRAGMEWMLRTSAGRKVRSGDAGLVSGLDDDDEAAVYDVNVQVVVINRRIPSRGTVSAESARTYLGSLSQSTETS